MHSRLGSSPHTWARTSSARLITPREPTGDREHRPLSQGWGGWSPVVLGFLGVGLGAEAAVLALRGGAEVLVCDGKGPFLDVELESPSPRGCCEGGKSWGQLAPPLGTGHLSSGIPPPSRAATPTAWVVPTAEVRSETCMPPTSEDPALCPCSPPQGAHVSCDSTAAGPSWAWRAHCRCAAHRPDPTRVPPGCAGWRGLSQAGGRCSEDGHRVGGWQAGGAGPQAAAEGAPGRACLRPCQGQGAVGEAGAEGGEGAPGRPLLRFSPSHPSVCNSPHTDLRATLWCGLSYHSHPADRQGARAPPWAACSRLRAACTYYTAVPSLRAAPVAGDLKHINALCSFLKLCDRWKSIRFTF